MKILLIKPPTSDKLPSLFHMLMMEPLELEYIAAGVSYKYDVRILDMRLDRSLDKVLEEYTPDIVGLTSYTYQVHTSRHICKKVKAFNPKILTVVGGHHATSVPEDFCDPNINIIVRGEGVFTFREIVEKTEKKQDINGIRGISFYHGNKLKSSAPREHTSLDSLPIPNRSLTVPYRKRYFTKSYPLMLKPFATLLISKGCPFRCIYCSLWKFTKEKGLTRDPYGVLEELKTLNEPYIYFADDNSFIDLKKMDKLADLIIDSGIKKDFISHAHSHTVVNHPDLFKKWRKAGMAQVSVGIESHRPKDLEYFGKRNTLEHNEKAISLLKKMEINPYLSFIISPDFDLKDFEDLSNYVDKLDVKFVIFYPLTPLPGTVLFNEVRDQLTTTNLELYDGTHMVMPTKLPLKIFNEELAKLYHKKHNFYRK